MSKLIDKVRVHWEGRDGFALPIVLLALVVMTTLSVAALTTASDEQKSARSVREAGRAFYVAEAGLWESWANWPADTVVAAISQGDSLDLGWKSLDNGAEYRGKIYRWGPSTFQLRVESRGAGPLGGQQWLSLLVHDETKKIGVCCDGPALVDGDTVIDDVDSEIIGQDAHPPGWEAAGVCSNGLEDSPGLIMKDTGELTVSGGGILDGVPDLVEDTTISEETFSEFGPDKTWEDLKDEAGLQIGAWGQSETVYQPEPSYNGSDCDTTDPNNWGSDDPTDPCFNFFRIILAQGDVAMWGPGYGQGMIILDWNESTNIGTEFDFEDGARFNGLILGKGCIEVQGGSVVTGAIFADGNYFNEDLCGGDAVLDVNDQPESINQSGGGHVLWSSCVIDRLLSSLDLDDYSSGGYTLVATRAFAQLPSSGRWLN